MSQLFPVFNPTYALYWVAVCIVVLLLLPCNEADTPAGVITVCKLTRRMFGNAVRGALLVLAVAITCAVIVLGLALGAVALATYAVLAFFYYTFWSKKK